MNPRHLRGEAQDFGRIKNFDLKSQKETLLDFRDFDSGRHYPMFGYKHWAYSGVRAFDWMKEFYSLKLSLEFRCRNSETECGNS